jgi:hypothetical protein
MLKEIILAIPLGILYSIFTHKIVDTVLSDMAYDTRYQKTILLLFIIGIVGIMIASTIFLSHPYFENTAIRYGLLFGSGLLMFYSLITNWHIMHDDTRFIMLAIVLAGLIWYCYSGPNKKIKKIRRKKLIKKE